MGKPIRTTIPFTDEELDKYFDDIENYAFIIDARGSVYKGEKLLTYIYNSGMKANVSLNDTYENTEKLLLAYIETDRIIDIPSLNEAWYKIIKNHLQGKENDFAKKYSDVIQEAISILRSLKAHLISKIFGEKQINLPIKSFSKIGKNIISLRNADDFWGLFAKLDQADEEICEYKELDDNVFDGRKASWYFLSEFNPFSILYMASKSKMENIEKLGRELQELASA